MYKLITQLGTNLFNVDLINKEKHILKPGEEERIRREQAFIYLNEYQISKNFSFSGNQLRYLMSLFNVSIIDICLELNIDDSSKIKFYLNTNSIISKDLSKKIILYFLNKT